MTELIAAPGVPVEAGPYSPGLVTGDWIFLSGQGGFAQRRRPGGQVREACPGPPCRG